MALDEVFVKINGEMLYLWRAVDHEGEVLESFVTKCRDHKAALNFLKKTMKRHGLPKVIVTDRLRSYCAAMKVIGNAEKQGTGRWRTELNGGWWQKGDAAAQLHNSGFIKVDKDDNPVEPPERYDHLIRDADRIRLCALNYYIEPARESGASEVSVRAGELAKDIVLLNAFPNICSDLGGEKMQQLAKVPAPTNTEPHPSSSTVFTYQLTTKEEQERHCQTKMA